MNALAESVTWETQLELAFLLLAALACGLLIGIERGWRQRDEPDGSRVAGVRTFTLIGSCGGLIAVAALHVSAILASVLLAGLVALLVGAFLRPRVAESRRDATTLVAAMAALCLGLLAGAGFAELALAGAALVTFVLAARQQAHGLLQALTPEEMRAIARFAVIAIAVLPFLPDAQYGPYDAWNPFKLWLVVVLVTGFSVAGYIANRVIGQNRGTIATALIGGAYSSTAVTAAFAGRLKQQHAGPFATGIALASAVMYLRVVLLAAVLAPGIALPILALLGPAAAVAFGVSGLTWTREKANHADSTELTSKPFELLPAFGFLLAVAGASLLVRWAQVEFGDAGAAISLFIAGSFDVDAALVAYSALPRDAVPVAIAAFALSGTVAVNMAFKVAIVFANAGLKSGRMAGFALLASLAVLIATLAIRAVSLFG